jgi:shikimate dehydrogenase
MLFGLLGKTLGHSFSKPFFEAYFKVNQLDASYSNFEIESIEEVKSVFDLEGLSGINVTFPYKESIIPFLDEISPEAKIIGAVNTVKIVEGKRIGFNTDAFGFQQSIKPFLTNLHEKALILGTGGASKAVAYVLKNIGIDTLYISRNPSNSNEFSYADLNEYMLRACKLIVNTTPVGTFPNINEAPEFPFHYLTTEHLVVDLIYNPSETLFLSNAKQAGATILNGESMLKEQALKSWEIWTSI